MNKVKNYLIACKDTKILPILCSLLLISIELLLLYSFISTFISLMLSFLLGALFGTFIYFIRRDFIGNSCMTLMATTLPTLGFIGLLTFYSNNKFDYIIVCLILINWFSINFACYTSRLFSSKIVINNFKRYSKQVSFLFIFSYVVLLSFLLFSSAFNYRAGVRSVNLIPFKTIIHYGTGAVHTSLHTIVVNIFGNILLFIPLGFYLKAFIRNHMWTILAILGVPIIIELTQYLFATGVSDIDDVLLNVLGAFIGYLLLLLLDIIYRTFSKNPDKNFLGF